MAQRVAVIGSGSWGTTFAALVCASGPAALWARRPELAAEVATSHTNGAYLPGVTLPSELTATASLERAVEGADVVAMAVPSHGFRAVLEAAARAVAPGVAVVSLTKGLEEGTRKRMTEVAAEALPGHPVGALTGPNLSREVLLGHPAASVLAMAEEAVALELRVRFSTPSFRVYTNPDVVGCEVAGAFKNVMAIAAGMSDGMGFGDNARAAIITRSLAELTRLGVAMGGDPLTFSGLAGMGDLVATCSSAQSRNHHVGEELGRGRPLEEIVAEMSMVAEGVKTSRVVCEIARDLGVEVPIAEQVEAVCHRGRSAVSAVAALMQRQPRHKLYGMGEAMAFVPAGPGSPRPA